jgi:RND family efflux transporter MFP subunit
MTSPEDPRRARRRFALVAAVAVVAFGLVVYFATRTKPRGQEAAADVVVSVRTGKAERRPIAAEASSLGTIFPREQATISPKVGGQITRMRLLKNAIVRAGDVIAVLEPADSSARDARANYEAARGLYERRRALYAQGGIALKEVEAARLALTTAANALRFAEDKTALGPGDSPPGRAPGEPLTYATVRAPIPGVVTDQFQFQGEFVAAGSKLVTIADLSEVVVKTQVADNVVAELHVGDPAAVLPADLPGQSLLGKVTLVSRSSDPVSRTVEVWVGLGNASGRLRAGSAAQVVVATKQTRDAIVVPASAISFDAPDKNTGTVMVVDATNVAHEIRVTVGIRTPQAVQITAGLQGGETVVIEGNYALPDGTRVELGSPTPTPAGAP